MIDMDELFQARVAIENAFCDEAREYPRNTPATNIGVAVENALLCGGLPFTTAKETKRGFPQNVTVVFHWRDCQTTMRGFTLEMYERAEKWLDELRGI